MHKPKWYAVYTRPRHEKKVYTEFQREKIDAFLPMHTTIRQWSDRRKKVFEPLFSSYVFVCVTRADYYRALNIDGVIRFVSIEGKAVAIPESQIRLIKNMLSVDLEVLDYSSKIPCGTKVEIYAGPLLGSIGYLVDYVGKKRVIIHLEQLNKTILVNIPMNYLALVG